MEKFYLESAPELLNTLTIQKKNIKEITTEETDSDRAQVEMLPHIYKFFVWPEDGRRQRKS